MAPRSMVRKVRPKKSYFLSAWEYVKLPILLRVPKIINCVSGPKRASFLSESGFSSQGGAEVHIKFFRQPQSLKKLQIHYNYNGATRRK
jgi:hypothetical protein